MNSTVKQKTFREGGIKEMLYIAIPVVVSSACDTVMTFTDRLFLSRLGPEIMNAAFAGGLSAILAMAMFTGLVGYTTALVAQYYGSKQYIHCSRTLFQAVLFSLMAYPIIIFVTRPLIIHLYQYLSISELQLEAQISYFAIMAFGTIIGLLRGALSGFFSGIGKTKIIMIATATSMLLNVGINYVLIFGKFGAPAMGIKGAAIGTIIGGVVGVLILIIHFFRKPFKEFIDKKATFRFDWSILKKLLRYGYPAGIEFFLNFTAFVLLIMFFQTHSAVTATAMTVVMNWDMVAFMPLLGIEIGVMSLVGKYLGAKDTKNAERSAWSGIKMSIIYSGIIFILFVFFSEPLIRVFAPAEYSQLFESSVGLSITMLRYASIYVLCEAFFMAVVGTLRGAGDTVWIMVSSVIIHYFFVFSAWLILFKLKLSAETAWLAIVIIFVSMCVLFFIRFKQGKWKNINMLEHD